MFDGADIIVSLFVDLCISTQTFPVGGADSLPSHGIHRESCRVPGWQRSPRQQRRKTAFRTNNSGFPPTHTQSSAVEVRAPVAALQRCPRLMTKVTVSNVWGCTNPHNTTQHNTTQPGRTRRTHTLYLKNVYDIAMFIL